MIKGHIKNKGTCDEHHKDIYEIDKLIRRIDTDFYMMPMHPPKMGNFTKMAGKKILQWGGGGAGVQGVQVWRVKVDFSPLAKSTNSASDTYQGGPVGSFAPDLATGRTTGSYQAVQKWLPLR